MPQDNERRRKLYDRLSEAGYYTKPYEDFNAVMDDPERGRKLYGKLSEAGFYTKPYEEFNSAFGPQKSSFQQPLRPMTAPASGVDGGALSGGLGTPSDVSQQPPTASVSPGPQGTQSEGTPPLPESVQPIRLDEAGDQVVDMPAEFLTRSRQQALSKIVTSTNDKSVRDDAMRQLDADKAIRARMDRVFAQKQEDRRLVDTQESRDLQFGLEPQPVPSMLPEGPATVLLDPREQKVRADYMKSLTPEQTAYRTSKQEAGAWTDRDAFDEDVSSLTNAMNVLDARERRLLRKSEFRKAQQQTDALGDVMYQNNDDVMAEANDIDLGRKYVYERLATAVRRHPEYASEELQRSAKTLRADVGSMTDPLAYNVAQPIRFAIDKFAVSMLTTPRSFGSAEYGLTDQVAEWAENSMENIRADEPSAFRGNIIEEGKVNPQRILPKVVETIGQAALLMGTSPTRPALLASSFVQTNGDYYKDARDKGLTNEQAQKFAWSAAALTSALELASPNDMARQAIGGTLRKEITDGLAQGLTTKEILRKAALAAGKEALPEMAQESGQYLGDKGAAYLANRILGSDKLDDQVKFSEFTENALLGGVVGSIAGGGTEAMRLSSIEQTAKNPQKVAQAAEAMGNKTALENVDRIVNTYAGNGLGAIPPQNAAKAADAIMRKEDVKQRISAAPMDPTLEAVQGDPRKKEEIALTMEAMTAMGIEPKKAVLALAGQGMLDMPEGAKVKKSADGTVDIEVKEPKEGEKGITKKEVIDDLEAQVKAILPDAKKVVASVFTEQPTGEEPTGAPTEVPEGGDAVTSVAPKPVTNEERTTTEAPTAPPTEDTGAAAGVPATAKPTAPEPVLTKDVPDDRLSLAAAYEQARKEHGDEGDVDAVLSALTAGNVSTKSYERFGDKNNVAQGMAKQYLRAKGRAIDEIAQEASGIVGKEVSPEDVVAFMERFPGGRPQRSERMVELDQRHGALYGTKLNKLVAKSILAKNKGKTPAWTPQERYIVDEAQAQGVELDELLDTDADTFDDMTDDEADAMFGGGPSTTTKFDLNAKRGPKQVQSGATPEDAGAVRGAEGTGAPQGEEPADAEEGVAEDLPMGGGTKASPEMRERVKSGVPLMQMPPVMRAAEAAARKASAILERAKLKGDKLYALPIPPSVWNGALTAMQKVIIAGGKAADAIAAAIKHIQASDWWKGATQQDRDKVTTHLNGRLEDLEAAIAAEESSVPPVMDSDEKVSATAARFVEYGTSKKAARAYMEQKGVPEENIKKVLDAMTKAKAAAKEGKETVKAAEEGTVKREPKKVVIRDEMAALKDQIRIVAKASREAALSGAIAGEIHGRREERAAAEKERDKLVAKAEREKEKLAQKRTDQGYASGLAQGTLAGEMHGKAEGRKEGAKEERARIANARKEFAKTVRETMKELGSKLSPLQVRSITASAARTNPASEKSVDRFVRHAERIIDNAQYAADVEKAKDYRKKAKKMSKRESVPLNHKEVLASMARMDVGALPDPAAFNAIAEQYMQQFAPMTQGYVPQSSADTLDALAKMHESAAEERFKERTEDADDALAGAMAAESADEFAEGIEEDAKEKLRDEMADMAEEAKFAITEQFDEEDLTGKERGIVKKLREADIQAMSLDQMREYIKTVDNIGINGSFDGAAKVAAMVEGVASVSKAREAVAGTPLRRAWTGNIGSFFQQQFSSTSGLFRFLFGMGEGMAKFHNALGATDLELSKKKYDDAVRDIKEKMSDFYTTHRKKHKNADSAETLASEAMIAFAVQPVRGYDAQQSFDIQKRIIEQNIERLGEKEKTAKEAELWQKAYDSMLKDAKSREDLLSKAKKNSPAAYESVMFLKDKVLAPYTDLLRAHKEQFWGEDFGENDMYLPITYRFFGKQEDLEPAKQGVFASDRVEKPKEAANLIGRKGVTSLPAGMVISPNLRRNVLTSSSRNLYDAYTSEVWQRMNQFFKTPGAASVVGGSENLDYLNFGLKTLQAAQRREGGGAQDKMDRAVGALIQRARKYASHLALGGIRQFLQQPADQLTNAVVNVGPQLVGRSITQVNKARPVLALSSIGDRGELIGGTNWDNTLEAEMASLARSLQGGLVDRFDASTEKIQRAIMFALTKSDVAAARTAWIAYYTKYIEENGGELMDWQKEADAIKNGDEFRREALAYATVNTDVTQGSSDPTKMARIAQHGGNSWQSLAKGVFNPFSSFTIGMRERITNDVADLLYGGNMYDENGEATPHGERAQRAARSLTATIAANAAFTAIRIYVVKAAITAGAEGLRALMQSAFGGDDDEKDDAENRLAMLALIFNMAHTMKMMDADIYRTVAEAYKQEKRENSDAPTNTDQEEAIKKAKLAYTSLLQSLMVSGYTPFIEAGSVDAINRMGYYIQLLGSDPARTNNGTPMKYESWVKEPENPPLYRTGQGYDSGDYGVMSVITDKLGSYGDQAQELFDTANDTPERKEERKVKEQKKERMSQMDAIADQVASGAMTWDEAMKHGREQLEKDGVKEEQTRDPQGEYINHLKSRIRYDRAPQWVKDVIDEKATKARVKLARKKLDSLSGEERVKEKQALKDAHVWTDAFDAEWARTK